ncbi:hypothetical protein Dsin_032302 [Dipteronia sinensis]|uniref:Endonuclease/exonuclease/phosphatase domain-containing protein n=1 Tax=Dipteronia sinensis TaxID=43782 RepID=A0AAD9ZMQ0_9ROSI|nr:hypothetical protein Dsin_032302 [Dipteronia sinensis]
MRKGVLVKQSKEVVFCNVYTPNVESERVELWDFILRAQASFPMPWCIEGDFNTVLHSAQRSGNDCNYGSMRAFSSFLLQAKLVQRGLTRSVSDHCAIMIGERSEDWGPCPFRFYNEWLEDGEMMKQAREGWLGVKSMGSYGFVLSFKFRAAKD